VSIVQEENVHGLAEKLRCPWYRPRYAGSTARCGATRPGDGRSLYCRRLYGNPGDGPRSIFADRPTAWGVLVQCKWPGGRPGNRDSRGSLSPASSLTGRCAAYSAASQGRGLRALPIPRLSHATARPGSDGRDGAGDVVLRPLICLDVSRATGE